MKFERIKKLPRIKQEIISYLFDEIARKDRDKWWKYKGNFKFNGKNYNLECECKWDNQMFTYRNMYIEHQQIEIDIEQAIKIGLLK